MMVSPKSLPFYLTLSRIVFAPLVSLPLFISTPFFWWLSAICFILLSLTDYFDGKLARKHNVVSDFGKFFDPTGDKILVLFALVTLVALKNLSPVILLILLSRDILLGSLRSFAASQQVILASRLLGKLKTTLQMVAIPLMLLPPLKWFSSAFYFGELILWLACLVSVLSFLDYARQLRIKKASD